MWESPPAGYGSGAYGSHQPVPRAAVLAMASSLLLAVDAVILPWVGWGFSVKDIPGFSSSFSLWDIVTSSGAAYAFGADWLNLVALGVGCALVGSIIEVAFRPVSPLSRWLALGGLAAAVGGCCLGLIVGVSAFGGLSGLEGAVTTQLEPGFWAGLAISTFGAIAAAVHLASPPNPVRVHLPFGESPWRPPGGVLPPGFTPAAPDNWSGYVDRGQLPPGYVPPSYGPAVYPSPGFMTPAYMPPGQVGPMLGPPYVGAGADASSGQPPAYGGEEPTPGRLTVVESGLASTLTVEPGKRLLVGRDAEADIRVADRKVSERHATIERRGRGWAVQDVDALKPTRLIDPWGMHRQVRGEIEVPAGQVMVGDVLITLYPDQG
jgi:hypothetical protein